MEGTTNNIFKGLLHFSLVLALCTVLRLADIFWLRPKRLEKYLRQQGIRGTSYKLLNGDMKELVRSSKQALSKPIPLNHKISQRVLPFFHRLVQDYGKVSLTWRGSTPRLILADPELIRLVLTDKSGDLGKPPQSPLVKLLQQGLASLEGEKWAKRRKSMTPAFHFEALKGMIPAISTSCSDLVHKWEKLVSPRGSCELEVAQEFQILTGDVIARTAFGSSYEDGKRIFELLKEQAPLFLEATYSLYFPCLRFIPTEKNKKRYSIDKEIKAIFRDMIYKKQQALRNEDPSNIDLLGLLLKCREHAENDMTIEDVIEECKLFYSAGQETTANLLSWTFVVLSMHRNWQEKAREEVLQICGKKTPDIDAINHLKIVSMVLHEVLRLYPPATVLHRHSLNKTSIQGMSIPAGVDLVLPSLFVHHDSEYWGDDVEEFKPERFAEGVSKASKNQISFYPFGWGPRICIGQNFAMIEAKMALAMILQHFWFELSPSYTHAPRTVLTLQPQHGAPIILHQL